MKKEKRKKTAKQKRILIASLLIAAAITVGGTFAWFTSQDEVTNQLSASSNYGVSITESFTPPSQWTPGQEVNKDVGAVNTGNVDAFVRLSISNTMDLITLTASDTAPTTSNNSGYVTLEDAEVTALQAGGVLAGAWKDSSTKIEVTNTDGTAFQPETTGLYFFMRDIDINDADNTHSYEYKGYYYDNGTYYALNSIVASGTSADGSLTNIPSVTYQVKQTVTVKPTLEFVEATSGDNAAPAYIKATYDNGTSNDTKDDIIINIKLADDWDKNWDKSTDGLTYYYAKLLKSGGKAEDLITAVELDKGVSQDAYYEFDYNLKISLDSVQVTSDNDGNQTADAVQTEGDDKWMIPNLTTSGKPETITSIQWTNSSNP